jgi:pimeloyl-ACP methyl ester carboxylesterase
MIEQLHYRSMDAIMCIVMNYVQWRLRHQATHRDLLEPYLEASSKIDRQQFFEVGPMEEFSSSEDSISWKSPSSSYAEEQGRAYALFFPSSKKDDHSKTMIILHALMSSKDQGYRNIAARLNAQGWNVLFPHLPFHYSRTPEGYLSGALAVTADLIRNGETMRLAVQEVRQLVQWRRAQGDDKIALLGTSYGGWLSSLLLSVEPVEGAILLQPIVDLRHATFRSPIAMVIAKLLQRRGITESALDRHAHLTSPMHGESLCHPQQIAIIGGSYDSVSPPRYLKELSQKWSGSSYYEVPQGHFGFLAMKQALALIDTWE